MPNEKDGAPNPETPDSNAPIPTETPQSGPEASAPETPPKEPGTSPEENPSETPEAGPGTDPEKPTAPPVLTGKDLKSALKPKAEFKHADREFIVLVARAVIPGVGRMTAAEIAVSTTAQKYLVECLDDRGSGIIREVF
jgi:hypothetical protein